MTSRAAAATHKYPDHRDPRLQRIPKRESRPSERQGPSIVDVSHADIEARAVAPSNEDRIDQQAHESRKTLAQLVEATVAAVGPERVEGVIDEGVRASVDRAPQRTGGCDAGIGSAGQLHGSQQADS